MELLSVIQLIRPLISINNMIRIHPRQITKLHHCPGGCFFSSHTASENKSWILSSTLRSKLWNHQWLSVKVDYISRCVLRPADLSLGVFVCLCVFATLRFISNRDPSLTCTLQLHHWGAVAHSSLLELGFIGEWDRTIDCWCAAVQVINPSPSIIWSRIWTKQQNEIPILEVVSINLCCSYYIDYCSSVHFLFFYQFGLNELFYTNDMIESWSLIPLTLLGRLVPDAQNASAHMWNNLVTCSDIFFLILQPLSR